MDARNEDFDFKPIINETIQKLEAIFEQQSLIQDLKEPDKSNAIKALEIKISGCFTEIFDEKISPDKKLSLYRKLSLIFHPDKNDSRLESKTRKFITQNPACKDILFKRLLPFKEIKSALPEFKSESPLNWLQEFFKLIRERIEIHTTLANIAERLAEEKLLSQDQIKELQEELTLGKEVLATSTRKLKETAPFASIFIFACENLSRYPSFLRYGFILPVLILLILGSAISLLLNLIPIAIADYLVVNPLRKIIDKAIDLLTNNKLSKQIEIIKETKFPEDRKKTMTFLAISVGLDANATDDDIAFMNYARQEQLTILTGKALPSFEEFKEDFTKGINKGVLQEYLKHSSHLQLIAIALAQELTDFQGNTLDIIIAILLWPTKLVLSAGLLLLTTALETADFLYRCGTSLVLASPPVAFIAVLNIPFVILDSPGFLYERYQDLKTYMTTPAPKKTGLEEKAGASNGKSWWQSFTSFWDKPSDSSQNEPPLLLTVTPAVPQPPTP